MKSKDTNKKLEFKKETIARLGEVDMSSFKGGQGTDKHGRTKPGNTCTCFTNGSELHCE